jgi:hypothetical protein
VVAVDTPLTSLAADLVAADAVPDKAVRRPFMGRHGDH